MMRYPCPVQHQAQAPLPQPCGQSQLEHRLRSDRCAVDFLFQQGLSRYVAPCRDQERGRQVNHVFECVSDQQLRAQTRADGGPVSPALAGSGLIFKWIKQHLRIKTFYGTTGNAVKTQIWIAVCTYVRIGIAKKRLHLPNSCPTVLMKSCKSRV